MKRFLVIRTPLDGVEVGRRTVSGYFSALDHKAAAEAIFKNQAWQNYRLIIVDDRSVYMKTLVFEYARTPHVQEI